MTSEEKRAATHDALVWVAQEARGVKMAGVLLPRESKLREALAALDKVNATPTVD